MKRTPPFSKGWMWMFFVGLMLIFLITMSISKPRWNPAEQWVIEVTAPLQRILRQVIRETEEFWLRYFYLVNVREENRRLRLELASLKMENSRYREWVGTHERLQALLEFRQTLDGPAVAARVTGWDPSGWFQSIMIDKGAKEGLTLDLPVVSESGVVGRIVSVSRDFAKVLLIIDQNSAVDCLIQRSRCRGMVKGLAAELCKMDYVAKSADIQMEDIVVTSGLEGVFPKGLPVGQVLRVKEAPGEFFKEVEVTPAVDFSKLEEVLVIVGGGEGSKPRAKKY